MPKLNIAVIYGGKSVEHEVSVHSAQTVCELLSKTYNVLPIYINKNGLWFLQDKCGFAEPTDRLITPVINSQTKFLVDGKAIEVDVVFPVLHGTNGEDGTIQGLFEMLDIPYVGCGVLTSAAGMDKEISKILAQYAGIPVVPWLKTTKEKFDIYAVKEAAARFGYPVFVKPLSLGSSVGVTKVKNADALEAAFNEAFQFEGIALMEKGVENAREIFCAIYGDGGNAEVSGCGELVPSGSEFFDYHAKYVDPNGCIAKVPADVPQDMQDKMRDYSLKIFAALRGCGLARADFLLGAEGDFYFSEINTLPGMSYTSLFPQLFRAGGKDYERILLDLVDMALSRAGEHKKFRTDKE